MIKGDKYTIKDRDILLVLDMIISLTESWLKPLKKFRQKLKESEV